MIRRRSGEVFEDNRTGPGPRTAAAYSYQFGGLGGAAAASSGTAQQQDLLGMLRRQHAQIAAVRNRVQLGRYRDGAAPRTFGVFFTGGGQTQVPFLRGYLCVERPLRRASSWVLTDRAGSGASELGKGRCWRRRKTPAAGETWNFTTWYRDVNPTPTSNFTDAISVLFH